MYLVTTISPRYALHGYPGGSTALLLDQGVCKGVALGWTSMTVQNCFALSGGLLGSGFGSHRPQPSRDINLRDYRYIAAKGQASTKLPLAIDHNRGIFALLRSEITAHVCTLLVTEPRKIVDAECLRRASFECCTPSFCTIIEVFSYNLVSFVTRRLMARPSGPA
jgi:hypothetical protein